MSKILFGAGVADARNKLGGHVFSKNRFGAYLRMKVSPSQPRTPKQLTIRSAFGGFSKAWGAALTAAQRAGWIALAAGNPVPDVFGNPQILTGLQFFQRVNRNLFTIAVAELDDAPPGTGVEAITGVTLTASAGTPTLSLAFTPTPLGATSHLVVQATGCISPGKVFVTPLLKQVFRDTAGATTSPANLLSGWEAIYGSLVEGQQIVISAYVIDDTTGAASTPAGASVIVAA